MYLVDVVDLGLVIVSCNFVIVWVPKVVPAQNDADGGDDDEPTSAMPHSHRQANTHRDQISRSGETPHSDKK